jgi:hypothetical protein
MTLLTELRYTDSIGAVWVAPIGSQVDGASIPRYLWSIMTGPFEGKMSERLRVTRCRVRGAQTAMAGLRPHVYNAMRCSGVSAVEAKTIYYALYKFGITGFPIKRAKPVKYEGALVARGEQIPRAIPVNPEQINEAHDWIRSANPSLDQIEQRADAEAW